MNILVSDVPYFTPVLCQFQDKEKRTGTPTYPPAIAASIHVLSTVWFSRLPTRPDFVPDFLRHTTWHPLFSDNRHIYHSASEIL